VPSTPSWQTDALEVQASGPPRRRVRERRGRGLRGPEVLPAVPGHSVRPTSRQCFDDLALRLVSEVDERWQDRLGLLEYAVEDAPQIPDDWHPDTVPLSSLIRGTGTQATRLVLFRRPIEHRCETRDELEALLLTVVVEQVSELLGLPAEDVDPRYEQP